MCYQSFNNLWICEFPYQLSFIFEICLASVHTERVTLRLRPRVTQLLHSNWVTNITINFATKFATKNEMGLIPIFATKLSE